MSLILEQRIFPGLSAFWRRCTAIFRDRSSPQDERSSRPKAIKLSLFAGIALLGAFWGGVGAIAGLNALFLCASLIGCAFILCDFRIGVVLLIVLRSISGRYVFPHEMLGITGLNPLNLLLIVTLGACLLQGLTDGGIRRFLPRPLLWLYSGPILVAGALGSRHVGEIAPGFYMSYAPPIEFHDVAGYLRDLLVKPLLMVIFALLVGAAVSRSEKPEKFLIPTLISIWMMSSIVTVFVLQSGVALNQLASSDSRAFLSPLGMHGNELGRLYVVTYALLLFTWAESKELGIKLVLLVSMGLVIVALVLTFSRGAFVGVIVVSLLFPLWRRNAKTLIFLGLLAAGALLAPPRPGYDPLSPGSAETLHLIHPGRHGVAVPPLLTSVLLIP